MRSYAQPLIERYAETLFSLNPESVLDVGCGEGTLLARCRERDVRSLGVEKGDDAIRKLSESGNEAVCADATRLPLRDGAVDWVSLRHVPHHLPDVPGALREALRVGRSGILIAEPWFDVGDPSQALALAVDEWIKVQHERGGMYHKPVWSAQRLIEALPKLPCVIQYEHFRPVVEVPKEDVVRALELWAPQSEDPGFKDYERLVRRLDNERVTYNGTMILCVRRGR